MRGDFLELRQRIVIAGGIHLVQEIVGVQPRKARLEIIIQVFVRGVPRGQRFLHIERRAPCNQKKIQHGAQRLLRLRGVFSALPFGIVANCIHHHLAPDAVAPGDLHRLACQRHQRIHEIGIGFSPNKGMHAAHRGAENEAQVVYAEAFAQKLVMRGDHVVVVVAREMRMQSVAGLRGFPVADAIGKHDEVACGIEELPRPKQLARELRLEELLPGAAGSVKYQDGVRDAPLRVAAGFTERRIVQPQFRKRLSRTKFEILDDEVAFRGLRRRGYLGKTIQAGEYDAKDRGHEETQLFGHKDLARLRIYHSRCMTLRTLRQATAGVSFRAYWI